MKYKARVEVSQGTGKDRVGWGCTETIETETPKQAKQKLQTQYQSKYPGHEIRVYNVRKS